MLRHGVSPIRMLRAKETSDERFDEGKRLMSYGVVVESDDGRPLAGRCKAGTSSMPMCAIEGAEAPAGRGMRLWSARPSPLEGGREAARGVPRDSLGMGGKGIERTRSRTGNRKVARPGDFGTLGQPSDSAPQFDLAATDLCFRIR
jgi:hypothetical protein